MPGVTSPRGYPYPLGPEPVDIAGDFRKLAEAIDDDVVTVNNRITTVDNRVTAVDNRVTSVNTNLQNQINSAIASINWNQAQISDLYARRALMYHAHNDAGIATAAGGWTQYQCGTLVLPTYNHNCMITVNCGMTSAGGGYVRLIGGTGASMVVGQGEAQLAHLAGETVMMSHTFHQQLGPGSYNISLWGSTQNAGNMGRAFVSVIATPY